MTKLEIAVDYLKYSTSIMELANAPNRYSHYLFTRGLAKIFNEREERKQAASQQQGVTGIGALHAAVDESQQSEEKKENG